MSNLYTFKKINNMDIAIYNMEAFEKLKKAGKLAYETLQHLKPFVKEGISTEELDKICHNFIIKNNAIPATLGYMGYPKSCCISLNHEICHGIPNEKKLMEGDILNIDITVILDGYYGDISDMFAVGKINPKAQKLINTTKDCLNSSMTILKAGIKLNEVGKIIEKIAHSNGFSVVEDFCGHGIGHQFHLAPNVLHYYNDENDIILEEGMVFTIEPMINAGKKEIKMLKNGWTAITKDFSLSAQCEHTIGITKNGCIVFTNPNN